MFLSGLNSGLNLPLAAAPELLAGSFGATAALVLVGGAVLLRWQKNRQQYAYMQAALEKGITQFPGSQPFWLLSLRQGVTVLSLGLALMLVGTGSWWLGKDAVRPTTEELKQAGPMPQGGPLGGLPAGPQGNQGSPQGGPQGGPQNGPMGRPGMRNPRDPLGLGPQGMGPGGQGLGPQGQGMPPGQGQPQQAPPPRPAPAVELWENAQTEKTLGKIAVGCGLILTILGAVRIGFARIERKYAAEASAQP